MAGAWSQLTNAASTAGMALVDAHHALAMAGNGGVPATAGGGGGGALSAANGVMQAAGGGAALAPGGWVEALLFYAIAAAVVVSVLGVCFSRDIVRMAVWLFVTLSSVAMLYFLLAATFLATIQLIVYVGGTLVLLVFGVMLTNRTPGVQRDCSLAEFYGAAGVCTALLTALVVLLGRPAWQAVTADVPAPTVMALGRLLVTEYVVPFEVAGVLLFVVMVGAAHLARTTE
jgi:NADH-quinone oxidoreductase subunit J